MIRLEKVFALPTEDEQVMALKKLLLETFPNGCDRYDPYSLIHILFETCYVSVSTSTKKVIPFDNRVVDRVAQDEELVAVFKESAPHLMRQWYLGDPAHRTHLFAYYLKNRWSKLGANDYPFEEWDRLHKLYKRVQLDSYLIQSKNPSSFFSLKGGIKNFKEENCYGLFWGNLGIY